MKVPAWIPDNISISGLIIEKLKGSGVFFSSYIMVAVDMHQELVV